MISLKIKKLIPNIIYGYCSGKTKIGGYINTKLKKLITGLTSIALSLSGVIGTASYNQKSSIQTEAAGETWKFDFGGGSVENGYTGVSASDSYNSSKGYGFNTPANMSNVSASGSGALSDAVQFKDTSISNTFNVDLPKGLYQVTVTLGNTNRTSIKAEGMLQLINMTGNNAVDTFQIPVTDGQLNIMATEGKAGYAFTMSSLEIKQINDTAEMNPTIWLCGDSTVCNYYPLSTSVQGGWGQMLEQYVDTNKYQIRNMAAGGQYAKGFVDAGQFEPIETYGKKGDYYIISIGINDTNYSNASEYYETVTSMVTKAKSKGMEVILVKQQGRNGDCQRNPLLTGRWFGGELDKIGSEQNCQVVDLFNLWQDYCLTLTADQVTELYMTNDGLHPNRQGAIKLAELFASQVDFGLNKIIEGAVIDESSKFMFKNSNSGLYMEVANGKAEAGANVQQWGASGAAIHNTWHVKSASDGFYYILSSLGDGNTYFLDLDYGKSDNGTNIGIYTDTKSDAQLFKFLDNGNGTYSILTKNSNCMSAVEVKDASNESGANIQQWERNNHPCQSWILEPVTEQPPTEPVDNTPFIYGDLNHDSTIDSFDMVLERKEVISSILSREDRRRADVNSDGYVNADDLTQLQSFILNSGNLEAVEYDKAFCYAVDQNVSEGVKESVNAGFRENEYINLDNKVGSFIEFKVNVIKGGNYLCNFGNANGSKNDRQIKIEVNQGKDYWIQSFISTGAWTTWTERGIVLPLKAGNNIIRLTSNTAEGGPNLDYMRCEWTDEPIAEIYVPPVVTTEPVADKPVIYIAGDSTVQSYRASYAPQQGWGYYLGNYMNDNVSVSNHAIAGRSSKSFYDNGRLDTILDSMKQGDYLLIQFGINDSAASIPERYAPVCGNVNSPTEGSFEYYIEKYISGAIDKGGTPILVTTVLGLKAYSGGKFVNSYGNYCQAMKDMSAKYNIPCIDLNSLMVSHYNSIGYDAAYNYHMCSTGDGNTDMTHFTETGANAVANLVADAIKKLDLPVSKFIK